MKKEEIFWLGLGLYKEVKERKEELKKKIKKRGEQMTSRERVIAAIEHKEVDRVPIMIWSEPHTTLKMAKIFPPKNPLENFAYKFCDFISSFALLEEIRQGFPLLFYFIQPTYLLELGSDAIDVIFYDPLKIYKGLRFVNGQFRIKDLYGIERVIGGLYFETVEVPCKTKKEIEDYRFPDLSSPSHYDSIRKFRQKFPEVAIAGWAPGVQDWSQGWLGMERLYTGMIDYPKTIKKFFRKLAQHSFQIIKGQLEAGADIIMIGDDYGSQKSLLISQEMWEEFTYPYLKKQIELIKSLGGKALLHSDGYIMPLLPKFVEAELDALHPLQPGAGNSFKEAKQNYGDKLCFFTGIDVQRIPFMTPEQVRKDIIENYRIGRKNSGFVLCTTHALQVTTPEENIIETIKTIKDIRCSNL